MSVCVSVLVWSGVWVWVCVLPNVLPILFHELPSGRRRGSLLQLQVYLGLCLVYLMNGCLSEEQRQKAERERERLMCVFKTQNREVVITDTVIKKCLLPWQMRDKSRATDPLSVQQPTDTERHREIQRKGRERRNDGVYN